MHTGQSFYVDILLCYIYVLYVHSMGNNMAKGAMWSGYDFFRRIINTGIDNSDITGMNVLFSYKCVSLYL